MAIDELKPIEKQSSSELQSGNDCNSHAPATSNLPNDWVEKATQSINRILDRDLCTFNEKVAREQKVMW